MLPGRKGDEDRGRKVTIQTERGREKFGSGRTAFFPYSTRPENDIAREGNIDRWKTIADSCTDRGKRVDDYWGFESVDK